MRLKGYKHAHILTAVIPTFLQKPDFKSVILFTTQLKVMVNGYDKHTTENRRRQTEIDYQRGCLIFSQILGNAVLKFLGFILGYMWSLFIIYFISFTCPLI